MSTDYDTFDVTTAGSSDQNYRLAKGTSLRHVGVDVAASSPPVLVRASLQYGVNGHVVAAGWVRGPSIGGSSMSIVWTGDLPITDRGARLQVSVRNDTGATVTVRANWVTS